MLDSGMEHDVHDQLLMTGDAAKICDVAPDTIRWWNRAGKLPEAHRTARGVRLYRRAEIERIARERDRARSGKGDFSCFDTSTSRGTYSVRTRFSQA